MHVLCTGPIPAHIAFIMDGNRRYEKKHNMEAGGGHTAGFLALMYVTVYAFSIDNFKRPAAEVNLLMNLMRDKIEDLLREESVISQYGIRIYFISNLKLLEESVRLAAERAMRATANNSNATLLICVAYTSTNEIIHAVEKSYKGQLDGTCCEEASSEMGDGSMVRLAEVERHLYMSVVPDPDIIIRSSGESRLSNFLLWQTANTLLCAPLALWPEMGFKDLCWAIINFQRSYSYLEKKPKQA
uniref:Alkyl transferase n=1 Tax=Kalanchoe fedtschenkoi TaxID=63787 RepID=A0A7N0UCL2_KALFE